MARLTYTINDDASQNRTSSVAVLNETIKMFGSLSTNASYIGYRITNVAIPNASTVRHAYLKVYVSSITSASNATVTVSCEAADNSAAFTASVNDLSSRTLTSASTAPVLSDLPEGFKVFDITTALQEVVNRAGWVSGNAITVLFTSPENSATALFHFTESSNDPEFRAIIDGSADSVRSPTVSGTGSYTNPNNAFSSNGAFATTTNLPSASQIYESFGIASLTGGTVDGILVSVEASVLSGSQEAQYTIELSWDGGTTWTTAKSAFQYTSTERTYLYGGADVWSHSFIPSEMTNTNFKVRITNDFRVSTEDARVDWLNVQVFYTLTSSSASPSSSPSTSPSASVSSSPSSSPSTSVSSSPSTSISSSPSGLPSTSPSSSPSSSPSASVS